MKIKFLFAVIFLFCAKVAVGQEKFTTSPGGLEYIIYHSGQGDKAKPGDVIKFNFLLKNNHDVDMVSSYKSGQPGLAFIQKPAYKGDVMEGFTMLARGDSGVFQVSADSFYKSDPSAQYQKGSMIRVYIKMLDVKSKADYMEDLEKENARLEAKELVDLDSLIRNKYPKAIKTTSGLYYIITRQGTGMKAKDGNKITAHYKGMLKDGQIFDTDSGKTAFQFKQGSHEVISGWEEGFALLSKGAKATLIIPSKLAYGPRGDGRVIAPSSTIIFEVELVDIK